jgi:phosphoribosylaminoimidazole-succinocarboxamide synthase
MSDIQLTAEIPGLHRYATGKVRDIFDLGNMLLIVASDRISAFDVVMPNGIPDKGRVLTQLSRFWFLHLRPFLPNHYITSDMHFIMARLEEAGVHITSDLYRRLEGRAMLTLKAKVFPVECVVRGYLAGSFWKEYQEAGGERHEVTLHGVPLPAGLRESDRLPHPIFTPATKAHSGHDENISLSQMRHIVGEEMAERLKEVSLELYEAAAERALENGIIIADTKFEFGYHQGSLTLVDEALTPDSSRFWDAATYTPGQPQPSFDKQYLRDWLLASGWNRQPPAPQLPAEVVRGTAARYREALRRLTGIELSGA